MTVMLEAIDLAKSFTMHLRRGVVLPVIAGASFRVHAGQCAVLGGPSGAGKSSILKMAYGNYAAGAGQILLTTPNGRIDLVSASPRQVVALRKSTIGYVSQFLSVVPRVSCLDIVAEPLAARTGVRDSARKKAARLLEQLNLAPQLWDLPPATFSGGEQQRVNIARGFITDHPVLLLDEPTASLDAVNRDVVIDMIEEKKRQGVALLGIFHDEQVRERVADTIVDVSGFRPGQTAA
ncbi:MAG: phosphonate C-P lyase system protein PhnL [Phyllobacteriaceae bacterium]|nr:phosphonate C-P lyase system protein PhnL [Phyllobacteriaceae bacterium]MBA90596.1 phosphonate C-P lyase system protein PhnL [Phyllobacteriaceae bacterium]